MQNPKRSFGTIFKKGHRKSLLVKWDFQVLEFDKENFS